MKNKAIALIASAGLALTPMGALLADTGAAKDTVSVSKAWVPATQAEQKNARGGGGYGMGYSLYNLQNTFCNYVTINISFCRGRDS